MNVEEPSNEAERTAVVGQYSDPSAFLPAERKEELGKYE